MQGHVCHERHIRGHALKECTPLFFFACIRVFVQNRGFSQEEIVQTCETCETQNSS